MKADELIINDWVYLVKDYGEPKKDILKIDALDLHRISDGMLEVEPIPLTPEILEKNGFIKESRENPGFNLQYCILTDGLWVGINGDNFLEGTQDYVHQLQHALKLCGIKKEIEL